MSPEILGFAALPGSESGGAVVWATEPLSMTCVRWGFLGLGLVANALLLTGRREGIWPAYVFLALGTLLFALVIVAIRGGTIVWGSGSGGIFPGIAAVTLFAFAGGGSIGYYVLALHVFRNWLGQAVSGGEQTSC